jgi:hypothetical protein
MSPLRDPYIGALACACFAEQGPGLFWLVISGNFRDGLIRELAPANQR